MAMFATDELKECVCDDEGLEQQKANSNRPVEAKKRNVLVYAVQAVLPRRRESQLYVGPTGLVHYPSGTQIYNLGFCETCLGCVLERSRVP